MLGKVSWESWFGFNARENGPGYTSHPAPLFSKVKHAPAWKKGSMYQIKYNLIQGLGQVVKLSTSRRLAALLRAACDRGWCVCVYVCF